MLFYNPHSPRGTINDLPPILLYFKKILQKPRHLQKSPGRQLPWKRIEVGVSIMNTDPGIAISSIQNFFNCR